MFSNKFLTYFKNILLFFCIIIFFQSCGAFKFERADVKDSPINDAEKRERNIKEGRGVTLPGGKGKSGTFDFATSNEMWRATIEVLDFVPLTTADYGGGIIITDWYSEQGNAQESIKITIRFLSNEIRSDAIDVDIFYKKCVVANNCKITKQDGQLKKEITKQILAKASVFKKQTKDKNFKPYRMSNDD